MVFEKQITIIKIILSTNFDDLIIEISDIIPKVEFLIFSPIFFMKFSGALPQ